MTRMLSWAGLAFCIGFLCQCVAGQIGFFGATGSAILAASAALLASSVAAVFIHEMGLPSLGRRFSGRVSMLIIAGALFAASIAPAFSLWLHPTENLMGANDEGVYAVTGINLAKTGSYFLKAPVLLNLPVKFRPWAVNELPAMANRTATPPSRFPAYHSCLFIADENRGLLASQFPIGFPAVLGSAYAIGGFPLLHCVNPFLLLVDSLLLGILSSRWIGRPAGAAAFILSLWFPLNLWAANSLFSEPLLLCLWLLCLWALSERENAPALAGILAGLAGGAALAVKIDAIPVALAICVLGISGRTFSSKPRWIFGCSFGLGLLVSLSGWWQFDRPYVQSTLRALVETNRTASITIVLIALAGLAVWPIYRIRLSAKAKATWNTLRRPALIGIVATLMALAAYAYFIRPHSGSGDSFYYWPLLKVIRSYREATFARFAWYWKPWGLAIAVLGCDTLFLKAEKGWNWLWICIGVLFLVSFSYDIRNNPIQPYAMRRFLPYAIPFTIVGAASLWYFPARLHERLRGIGTCVTAAALLIGFYTINSRLNVSQEFPALIDQIENLADMIPSNSVILTPAEGSQARLATPLQFAFGKPCILVQSHLPTPYFDRAAGEALTLWQSEGKKVLILSNRANDSLGIFGIRPKLLSRGRISTMVTVESAEKLVTDQSPLEINYTLTELPRL